MAAPLTHYLTYLRASRRMSQVAFGHLIGLAGSHVSVIERGKRYAPTAKQLVPLISSLNLASEEVDQLGIAIRQSPRCLRIPPYASQEAYRFVSVLQANWDAMSPKEFEVLGQVVERLSLRSPSLHKEVTMAS